jgi:hypothetical protein
MPSCASRLIRRRVSSGREVLATVQKRVAHSALSSSVRPSVPVRLWALSACLCPTSPCLWSRSACLWPVSAGLRSASLVSSSRTTRSRRNDRTPVVSNCLRAESIVIAAPIRCGGLLCRSNRGAAYCQYNKQAYLTHVKSMSLVLADASGDRMRGPSTSRT